MGNHTVIIAEAGVNHNGSMFFARKLIETAASAGVDYVKFQTFKTGLLVTKQAKQAVYQVENTKLESSQYEMLKKLELTPEQHIELIEYCNQCGVAFLSTAFDMESVEFLSSLHLDVWKIPSGEITNYPYLKRIAQEKLPIILSSGMSTMEDIRRAVEVLVRHGANKEHITVLHCNTQYPTPMQDVNLLAMTNIAREIGIKVGYSDHTLGIEVPIAAVALGARVIEKHFTLDRHMEGPDHKASLEPDELKAMVSSIRHIEEALGSSEKGISASESENMSVARKSIVAAKAITKGTLFTEENLTVKRPGTGISPMRWGEVLGKAAIRDFSEDELIEV
jgi:N,N'-diacetyllegionaminate synthase